MLNLRSLPKDIQGILPLKPLKENTIQRNAILFYKQDIQGKYPLKPLKENTIQENSILLVKQDKYSLFIITLDLI